MSGRPAAALLLALPGVALADTAGSDSSTAQILANLFQGCWSCGAFNTIGAIGLSFADKVFAQLASGMTILVGLAMALWVLSFAAKLFLPFGPPGAGHWNEGATKLFKLAMVLAFLQGSGPFWDYVFTPVISTSLGIASALASASDSYESQFGQTEKVPSGVTDYCSGTPPSTEVGGLSGPTSEAVAALEQMDCPMSRMQSQYAKGIMIGVSVMGQMGCEKSWIPSILPSNAAISYLVAGLILVALYTFGFLVFPFLLIDVLMRVVLVAATSPLAIAATLFKPTARIAQRALWSLAQCGLTLMFGAATAGIGKALMAYILDQISGTQSGGALTSWSSLSSAIENACSQGFAVNFGTASFYELAGTALIMIFMMRRAVSMASELTGAGGGTGAQAAFAAMAGAAGSMTGKAAKVALRHHLRRDSPGKASEVTGNAPN